MKKFDPPFWPNPTLGNHDLNKPEYNLPKVTFTQVSAFLAKQVLIAIMPKGLSAK